MAAVQQIDLEKLQALIIQEPLVLAGKEFGDLGSERMKCILRFLRQCARHATVHEKSDVLVFALMQPDTLVDNHRLTHAQPFQFGVTARGRIHTLIVEIRTDGSPFVWTALPAEVKTAAHTGLVYRLQQNVEEFTIKGTNAPVTKVIPGAVSQFMVNTFTELRDALVAYRDSMARTSKCHLLREAWADTNRLWFKTKPEYRLRRALHNHLCSFLRHDEIDLREEQNVDDSHPVDIKVVWRMENRSAIIEIKWVGKSFDITAGKITASYGDARARKGAKQLAEYLEWHREQAAKEDTRGYLVIFDCRRNRLKLGISTLVRTAGFHFERQEVCYKPEYHKTRDDFEKPIRMFLEPICV